MREIVRCAGDMGERRSCGERSLLRLLVAGAWRDFLLCKSGTRSFVGVFGKGLAV